MILTTVEAAEQAGVSPATIRSWVHRGHLKPLRANANPLRFRWADVADAQLRLRTPAWRRRHAELAQEWADACDTP